MAPIPPDPANRTEKSSPAPAVPKFRRGEIPMPAGATPAVLVPAEMAAIVVPAATPVPACGFVPTTPLPAATAVPATTPPATAVTATPAVPATLVSRFGRGSRDNSHHRGSGEQLRHHIMVCHR